MSEIKLGIVAKDRITGFQGVVTGKTEYLTGCRQFLLAPQEDPSNISGTPVRELKPSNWFDEGRLVLVMELYTTDDFKAETDGCDIAAPIK